MYRSRELRAHHRVELFVFPLFGGILSSATVHRLVQARKSVKGSYEFPRVVAILADDYGWADVN